MRLTHDEKYQVEDSLNTAGYSLPRQQLVQFVSRIEASIAAYQDAHGGSSTREATKALTHLWKLTQKYDPGKPAQENDKIVDHIREDIKNLPEGALEFVERRLSAGAFLPDVTDFRQWAQSADAPDLVVAARALSAFGASWAPGRSRGSGKRSGPRLEPIIGQAQRGGRPSNSGKFSLIADLAVDWVCVTGEQPKPGRGIETGFGYLAYSVFGWIDHLDEDDDSIHHALRQYWEAVSEGRNGSDGRASEPDERPEK
jgi:hypothetical protein